MTVRANTLLTTRENLGDRRSSGVEFSVMGMLSFPLEGQIAKAIYWLGGLFGG